MVDLDSLLTDLAAESAALETLVVRLPEADWARPTPAPGWTVAHQIAHLAWTDHVATLAATDVDAFAESIRHAANDPSGFIDRGAAEFLAPVPELLQRWRAGRSALDRALRDVPAGTKMPWYGTRMSATSMATARIMETWAHGEDIADTLGITRTPTARLRHVAYLGARTVGHAFATHGRPIPEAPVRVELTGPDGEPWHFGPADAADRVSGPALDFCLLVTQRRHHADLALVAVGPVATEWLGIAQVFAGPPGPGRRPADHRGSGERDEPAGVS
ncbi:TIGR03084 family metal-binding protein [Plantactinospora sp. BB1]|uniref:TIGR03084 family metal-binding protein n=1 Tax=Plantactinospora sp. BB1 TaxID=2071627 RepID=UPI000D155423|nr:TIGR03084 family metal-binding protein [Plantactinospora sp. BB1]AVT36267.1 TIGR03084 family protein [Plantactinospora sp. BB1]